MQLLQWEKSQQARRIAELESVLKQTKKSDEIPAGVAGVNRTNPFIDVEEVSDPKQRYSDLLSFATRSLDNIDSTPGPAENISADKVGPWKLERDSRVVGEERMKDRVTRPLAVLTLFPTGTVVGSHGMSTSVIFRVAS